MSLEFNFEFTTNLDGIIQQKSKFDKSVYEYIDISHDWYKRRHKALCVFDELEILLKMLGCTNINNRLPRIYIEDETLKGAIEEKLYFDRKFNDLIRYCYERDKLYSKIYAIDISIDDYINAMIPCTEYLLRYFWDEFT